MSSFHAVLSKVPRVVFVTEEQMALVAQPCRELLCTARWKHFAAEAAALRRAWIESQKSDVTVKHEPAAVSPVVPLSVERAVPLTAHRARVERDPSTAAGQHGDSHPPATTVCASVPVGVHYAARACFYAPFG